MVVKVQLVVCDVCQTPGVETRHLDLRIDDERVTLDLCDEHAKPVIEMFDLFRESHGVSAGRRPHGGRGRKVHTLEEIEEMKKESKPDSQG